MSLALLAKVRLDWKDLPDKKNSSLFGLFVSDEELNFIGFAPGPELQNFLQP